ncbi:hypothetical protein FKM82_010845 [Ascaphus truei]
MVAFICPKVRSKAETGAIIGTIANIFGQLAKWCQTIGGKDYGRTLTIHPLCFKAYQLMEKKDRAQSEGLLGETLWAGPHPLQEPPAAAYRG